MYEWLRKKGPKIPRIFHRFYAWLFGYFWLPCPICGRFFGGHEESANLMTSWYGGVLVCDDHCIEEVRRRNEEFKAENPPPSRILLQEDEKCMSDN